MRLSRLAVTSIVLALAMSAGCIENMGDLKEALGVVPPPPPAPEYAPPFAKMQANLTTPMVGQPVRFTSEGSRDPQGLPLTFVWDFGEGAVASGASALFTFPAAGERTVRLTVTSAAGLRDEDALTLRVLPLDLAPSAAIRVADAAGAAASRAAMGEPLTFEAVATDPEGAPLSFDWDFGDGATSHDARITRAYAAPGAYEVRLAAKDAAGQVAHASARVLVDGAWSAEGAFEPGGADGAETAFTVPAGAREVGATLRFASGLGLNDVEVTLVDAAGAAVASSAAAPAPGAQGDAERALTLGARELAGAKSGAWTAKVAREGGLAVAWTLELRVRM